MGMKTFAIATPVSLVAWFGIYELAVGAYTLATGVSLASVLNLSHSLTLGLLLH